MNERKMTKDDFTEDELSLLRLAFKLVGDVVEHQRQGNYDVYMSNELFHLENKLGIYDLLEE
jgi:hypothetical protein